MAYKVYSKKRPYSFTWGAYPTIELITQRPDILERVLIHSQTEAKLRATIEGLVPSDKLRYNDPLLEKLAHRENVYILGVFRPEWPRLDHESHIVLHEPANFGNLGTIIRTALGLGFRNLALIGNACDVNNPQVIRASMGAIFSMQIEQFPDFASYRATFPNHHSYAFMGGSSTQLQQLRSITSPYSLIFGNESRGLPDEVAEFADPVAIPMSSAIDSYNITIAAGIALYHFASHSGQLRSD